MPLPDAFRDLVPVRPPGFERNKPSAASTSCWGPDMWQVLHGISFHVREPALVARLVALLGILLPCKFCRTSWPAFVGQLVESTGQSVEEHVAAGTFPKFLYDAHNLVNDKLTRQRLADVSVALAGALSRELGLPPSTDIDQVAAAVCTAAADTPGAYAQLDKRPTFECLTKRYYIAGETPFSCGAIWRSLLLFTLNFGGDKTAPFLELLQVLAACLRTMPSPALLHTSAILERAATVLARAAGSGMAELTQEEVFGVVALSQAECEGKHDELSTRAARQAYLADLHGRVEVAAAGVCLNGVCK